MSHAAAETCILCHMNGMGVYPCQAHKHFTCRRVADVVALEEEAHVRSHAEAAESYPFGEEQSSVVCDCLPV